MAYGCLEADGGLLLQRYDETLGMDGPWPSAHGCMVKAPLGKATPIAIRLVDGWLTGGMLGSIGSEVS